MAEIAESQHKEGKKVRSKRRSTRIDMTPMVDLGFLLVTFFIFTTTLSKANTMQLLMPPEIDNKINVIPPPVPEKEVLVLLMSKDNRVFWYNPSMDGAAPEIKTIGYGPKGLRKLIQDEKKRVTSLSWAPGAKEPRKLTVLIKPASESTYTNFIDILDEMNINGITRYITVDPDPKELEMIKTSEANAK